MNVLYSNVKLISFHSNRKPFSPIHKIYYTKSYIGLFLHPDRRYIPCYPVYKAMILYPANQCTNDGDGNIDHEMGEMEESYIGENDIEVD